MNKYGIIFCALFLASFSVCQNGLNFENYKLVIRGYLMGLTIQQQHLDHLMGCLYQDERSQATFSELMDKIDKLDFQNLPLTASLFADLYECMSYSIIAIDYCAHDNPEYDRIFQKIYHMMRPTLIKRLMLNFVSNPQAIFKDIQDAVDNYLLKKFQRLGQDLGEIMHIILTFANPKLTPEEILKILKGFLEGLNTNQEFSELLKCLESTPVVFDKILVVIDIIKNIKFTDISAIIQAVMKIIAEVKEIIADLEPCGSSIEELKKVLLKLLGIDPLKLMQRIMESFTIIISTVMKIGEAFKDKKYEECGKLFGDLVHKIFLSPMAALTE